MEGRLEVGGIWKGTWEGEGRRAQGRKVKVEGTWEGG